MQCNLEQIKIAIIGLGYVGLPLAVEFGKYYATIGFDINQARINELNRGEDHTLEVSRDELAEAARGLRRGRSISTLAGSAGRR